MVNIETFGRRVNRSRNDFIARYMTAVERRDAAGRISSLAARWAAKEATMKALGIGIGRLDPTDVEVVSKNGQPTLRLHRNAAHRAAALGLDRWSVSLTHESGWAMAFVVAIGGMENGRH
ncbi:holo-ACP synthase [Arthrobacter sp. Z4-13]